MFLRSYSDAVDQASDQEDSGIVPDQEADDSAAGDQASDQEDSGIVPDQEADDSAAGDQASDQEDSGTVPDQEPGDSDAGDQASDQEDSGIVPDQEPGDSDAGDQVSDQEDSGTVPDQEPGDSDAGDIENDGGDNIVGSDTGDDAVSDGSDDSQADFGSGLSDGEGEDASDLEGDASDLDTLPSDDEDAVSDFNPEYYISDGVLYSSDGVALDRDVYVFPASVTASNAVYTPTAWQVNLAENRKFGEHYLMWAQRVYSGSSYYWRYYLALGRDIRYASNVYTYVDAEVFSYYSYNSSVTYDVSVSSGTVSGSSYLVFSDLYFDYVGVDPAASSVVYVLFFMFVMLFAILMRRKM